ncbi:type VI secretion system contractile sheath large subunit [uncultured Mailhella sp.]|uniref:type VI secretion system contractile sheath large subunit n=1 Tax=uncultured Mailhella sp. TaxID=1981031 RepID=UPI0025FDAE09|nr:type VI secretion system contractile sheath large subunit [uncultured Mailhella sp.]
MSQTEQEKQQTTTEGLSLLDEIVEASRLKPADDGYALTRAGLQAFIKELAGTKGEQKISGALVDEMIAELDAKLSAQVNEILHNESFSRLESAWRSMKFLVDNTDFRQNIKIEFINVSKSDLLDDFEDAPEVVKSGLYKHVYTAEYGQFGGQPVGAIIANYEFGPKPQDMQLLQYVASVASMSHAPFIAAAGKEFFGIDSWDQLPNLKDLHSVFEMPQYAKWRSFRESEDARYVGLTLPKFLLRLPYGENSVPAKSFNFKEEAVRDDEFCWGNTAFCFASRLTDSFAKYRWCSNIIGPQGGGAVENLPLYQFESMGQMQTKIPTQVLISERREYELAEEGFIALTMRKGSDNAAFFSANSVLKPKTFPNTPEGKEAEMNFKLSTQLPYMMIMNRLAHYIKVIQRENIGSWKERVNLERELNKWISQYVTEMDNPDPTTRSKRPLRMAKITVSDVEGDPGWYSVSLMARPHFKYMGASFTLSLVGKLEKQ